MRYGVLAGVLALLVAGPVLHAQFSETTGAVAVNAGSVIGIELEVDFANSASQETFSITVIASDCSVAGYFTDIDRAAAATDIIQWDAAEVYYSSQGAPGTVQFDYTVPASYSPGGSRLFSFFARPGNVASASATVTFSINNGTGGATSANFGGSISVAVDDQIGPSGDSFGVQIEVSNGKVGWFACEVAGTQDAVEHEFTINFGQTATTEPTNIGVSFAAISNAAFTPFGDGDLTLDFYDLNEDGYSAPTVSHTLTVPSGTLDSVAFTHQYPAGLQGFHDFRIVIRPGNNFNPVVGYFLSMAVESVNGVRLNPTSLTGYTPQQARDEFDIDSSGTGLDVTPGIGSGWTSNETLTASGGTTGGTYTWSVVSPSWISPTTPNSDSTTLQVTGTVGSQGPLDIVVRLENDYGGALRQSIEWVEVTFSATVGAGAGVGIDITTASLPDAIAGTPYDYASVTATANGTSGTYAWSLTGAPGWMQINGTGLTATFSGTPPAAATGVTFTVNVEDAADPLINDSRQYTIDVLSAGSLVISSPGSLPDAVVGQSYPSTDITALGGTGAHTWTVTVGPSWMGVSGTGSTASVVNTSTVEPANPAVNVTIQVEDSNGAIGSRSYTIAVTNPPLPSPGAGSGGGGGCSVSGGSSLWLIAIAAIGGLAFLRRRRIAAG